MPRCHRRPPSSAPVQSGASVPSLISFLRPSSERCFRSLPHLSPLRQAFSPLSLSLISFLLISPHLSLRFPMLRCHRRPPSSAPVQSGVSAPSLISLPCVKRFPAFPLPHLPTLIRCKVTTFFPHHHTQPQKLHPFTPHAPSFPPIPVAKPFFRLIPPHHSPRLPPPSHPPPQCKAVLPLCPPSFLPPFTPTFSPSLTRTRTRTYNYISSPTPIPPKIPSPTLTTPKRPPFYPYNPSQSPQMPLFHKKSHKK